MPATTLVSYCMTAKKRFFFLFLSWDKMQYLDDIRRGADVQLHWCENAFEYRLGLAQLKRLNRNNLG